MLCRPSIPTAPAPQHRRRSSQPALPLPFAAPSVLSVSPPQRLSALEPPPISHPPMLGFCAAPHVRVGNDSGSRRKGAGAYREKEARSILPRKWIRRARPCPRTGSWWSSTTRLRCYNACSVPSTSIGARAPAVDEGGDGSALSPHSIG